MLTSDVICTKGSYDIGATPPIRISQLLYSMQKNLGMRTHQNTQRIISVGVHKNLLEFLLLKRVKVAD